MKRALPDVHLEKDGRGLALDRVGVRGLSLPVKVPRADGGTLATVGTFDLSVSLGARERGAHLSRLAAAVQGRRGAFDLEALVGLAGELRTELRAREASVRLRFPFFVDKVAPVSGASSVLEVQASLGVTLGPGVRERFLEVTVPVATLCPCSKAISEAGAHNQRTLLRVQAWLREEPRRGALSALSARALALEELVAIAEEASSCELYPVLKRPDEKFVTERAFARPRFVEDVVREAAFPLLRDARLLRWELEARSLESIHAHDAWALLSGRSL